MNRLLNWYLQPLKLFVSNDTLLYYFRFCRQIIEQSLNNFTVEENTKLPNKKLKNLSHQTIN